jgi:hypothetical protein
MSHDSLFTVLFLAFHISLDENGDNTWLYYETDKRTAGSKINFGAKPKRFP